MLEDNHYNNSSKNMRTLQFRYRLTAIRYPLGASIKVACLMMLFSLVSLTNFAQTSYSLQQAIDYAIKNNISVKNADLDVKSATARIGETRAIGLPQISGSASITDYLDVPTSFLPTILFDRNAPAGSFTPVKFSQQFSGSASISASQMIFNGSYFVGLQAAKTYKELYTKSLISSKQTVIENVSKAYYGVLVNEEQIELLKTNIARLDTLFQQTKAQNINGFVEKIDVDRIEVQLNNLKSEYEKVQNLIKLSYEVLKFQMNVPVTEVIVVSDKLKNLDQATFTPVEPSNFDYTNRIEYSLLQTQEALYLLDIKNTKVGYFPSLYFSASYGYNTSRNLLKEVFNEPWFKVSTIGVSLNVPIFDGLSKYYRTQQSKISLEKTINSKSQLKSSIDFQLKQANITIENALSSLKIQKKNLELAENVVRVTKIKYQEGVGSNIEVINAEASLKEAQTNYYAALYDALIAKVDLDKATGKLYDGK
jgi:outer membrane protein TolC